MYQNAQRDRAMEAEISESRETLAANLTALERAGSRALLGGTQAQAEIQRETVAQAAQRGFQREQAALGKLAAAQQRTMDANITAEQAERTRKLLEAQMGYQAGMETAISGLQGAAAAGIGAADGLGGSPGTKSAVEATTQGPDIAGMTLDDSAIVDIDQPEDITVEDVIDARGVNFSEASAFGADITGRSLGSSVAGFGQNPLAVGMIPEYLRDFRNPADLEAMALENDLNAFSAFTTKPGLNAPIVLPYTPETDFRLFQGVYREQGGSVKLKGEFDHSTNPKYVYDKNGNVEAEMTGDETLVFNPKQRRFLKKVLKDLMSKGKATANKAEANKTFKAFK